MTAGRRKIRSPKGAAPALLGLALLAAAPAAALNLFGSGSAAAASDADGGPASAPDRPELHQRESEPAIGQEVNSLGQPTYGVDVSFPIHHERLSDNYAWLPHNVDPANNPTPPEYEGKNVQYMGDKQAEYDKFLEGCDAHYGGGRGYSACRVTEQDRVEMSLRQPQSMQNYTDLGFKKIRAPKEVWDKVKKFWDENKDRKNWKSENWPKGNTYTNHVSFVDCRDGGFVWFR